ncbi:polysaccharide lyase family 7 protein [Winogradskyella costae]|uniref:polysaccharide lyase family 7 protein n=1 Tax=Winogradskyella costae TaxID=2697008 RepID=UPI0015C7FFA2|nr:polysaccharide lyase family 7 protein [Winogradskyella costae]
MKPKHSKRLVHFYLIMSISLVLISCGNSDKKTITKPNETIKYPSDVIPFMDGWSSILCGDGTSLKTLENTEHKNFFYAISDEESDWVVFKAPNAGVTTKTSNNTRTELRNMTRWTPQEGGKLSGTLKVMHVSTSGDARVAAAYSVVVGQIHSKEGHENEPVKLFYKKFPGHQKGSVFWNYEINTAGDNSGRWDFSTGVWGNDMSVVGKSPTSYPKEPKEGIELGEEFFYEINVYNGIMYLTFSSKGHETKTFTKNLMISDFSRKSDIPQQIKTLYEPIARDGVERKNAYADELHTFMQGAYNQTNGKNPEDNIVWHTGSKTYNGDIDKQYANGCYAEVWFKEATIGPGTNPKK